MQWPVVARFTERLDPAVGEEWQEDEYLLVARSWQHWVVILLSSRNIRGSANQGQVGQIVKVQDGVATTGYVPEGPVKERLSEMTDLELETLLGTFPASAEAVSKESLKGEGAMNITPTFNQRWLDPAHIPAEAERREQGRWSQEREERAMAVSVRPEAVVDFSWQLCCPGVAGSVIVDALKEVGTGLPLILTVALPDQTETVEIKSFRDKAEDSATRAGLISGLSSDS